MKKTLSIILSLIFLAMLTVLIAGVYRFNFNNDGDAAKSLTTKLWVWEKTEMNDDSSMTPKKKGAFSLSFGKDNNVNITTDCNNMSGTYSLKDNTLTFGPMMATEMFCEGSQEDEFASKLKQVQNYLFTDDGKLVLEIKMDSGVMIFK